MNNRKQQENRKNEKSPKKNILNTKIIKSQNTRKKSVPNPKIINKIKPKT